MRARIVVGLIEKITVYGKDIVTDSKARIDTGAKSNSIDIRFAESLGIRPGRIKTIVKSAMGKTERHVVNLEIDIAGRKVKGRFTLADRGNLKYPVLIGRNILKKGFIIDPAKKTR